MAVTRRYWTTVGLAALLALWAAFLGSPLPLAGAALVLGWLLARQYRFVRAASATADRLAVDQRVERRRVTAEDIHPSPTGWLPSCEQRHGTGNIPCSNGWTSLIKLNFNI